MAMGKLVIASALACLLVAFVTFSTGPSATGQVGTDAFSLDEAAALVQKDLSIKHRENPSNPMQAPEEEQEQKVEGGLDELHEWQKGQDYIESGKTGFQVTESMKKLQENLDKNNPFVSAVGTDRHGAAIEGFAQEVAVQAGMQSKVFNEMSQRHMKKRAMELVEKQKKGEKDKKKMAFAAKSKERDAEIERLEQKLAAKKAKKAGSA
eukprot:gnl/TRDRNA2_/TRDRNA2_84439_c0_seq2.p1 gnl/TRDRNA2_/TRDRNA2_84439_c0~~gnl/TRDRNA2_/TRDRNA2_84439_c0_seq2.p1  ORF type:complete len:208 (+),score=69.33 gnl/TRDRNA2_/TRDRNA2_84439_c0_seq2:102-725(+)